MRRFPGGFTLLEIIFTLVMLGVAGVMIVPFFISGVTKSHLPYAGLQDTANLQQVMENIYRDYITDDNLQCSPQPAATLCTANKLCSVKVHTDQTYCSSTATLQTVIGSAGSTGNSRYNDTSGQPWSVVENAPFAFPDASNSTGFPLRVTIRNSKNEQLSMLFPVRFLKGP